jgi:hypothetical protein
VARPELINPSLNLLTQFTNFRMCILTWSGDYKEANLLAPSRPNPSKIKMHKATEKCSYCLFVCVCLFVSFFLSLSLPQHTKWLSTSEKKEPLETVIGFRCNWKWHIYEENVGVFWSWRPTWQARLLIDRTGQCMTATAWSIVITLHYHISWCVTSSVSRS